MEYQTKSPGFFSLEDLRFHWQGAEFKKEAEGICGGGECLALLASNSRDGSSSIFIVYRHWKWKDQNIWEVVR